MAALPLSPTLFFDTINAFQRAAALNTAIELKLFTAISEGHDTPEKLASRCQTAVRGARILADYLVVIGFLTKNAGRYGLTPDSAAFLVEGTRTYVGGAALFLYDQRQRDVCADLTARVRRGGAPPDGDHVLDPESDVWVKFARGMAGMMTLIAQMLARKLIVGNAATQPLKVLDIAAGHGLFGAFIARENPQARIVAQDWGNVLEVAKENAEKFGVASRFEYLPGSVFDVDFGTGYDLVLVTNILHHFDPPTNEKLMRKVYAALKPGGRAATLEFIPNDDRITPPNSAAFALIMLAGTPGGDAYTFRELHQMMQNAGFARSECLDLAPTLQRVVISHKA